MVSVLGSAAGAGEARARVVAKKRVVAAMNFMVNGCGVCGGMWSSKWVGNGKGLIEDFLLEVLIDVVVV
jgi:hypothetical protein